MSNDNLLKASADIPLMQGVVRIKGRDDIHVHQLSSAERFEYKADVGRLIEGAITEEAHYDKWMPRLLFGENKKLKPAQLKNLKKSTDEQIERAVYETVDFFPVDDAIKK